MFPAPGSGGGGDSGGETSSKMISAAPGINKVGDFKIGSSSDESDPLLVASSQQQRKLNGARKPANFRKNGSRHRQVAASVSSIESTSRDSAEVSCSSFIRPLTAEETPDTEHSLSAGKPRVGEESRTFQTCAPPPDLITGDTKRTAEAADKPDPAAIPWTLDETLQVVKDTVGGVSIEMQKASLHISFFCSVQYSYNKLVGTSEKMKPGERIGNASRPRPPASLSLMEKRLSLLHRAQTTDSNPSRRLKNDVRDTTSFCLPEVKINVNTPTEDSCSPEELEHFIPSQDPAACRAELDILGTVYQVPQLLSPSRNPSQKLSASPRQLQRKSVGSFEPAAFAKARSNRPKSARERSTTESTASANTKSAQDLSTPAGEKHPIQRQIAQEISTSLDSLTTAVDKSEEPKEAPASEFRIKGFPGSCGVSKKPEENPSPAGDHVVEEPSIIETQEEISGAALTLRSILKSLSNSNAFIPNKTRTARKTRRSKTVDGGADDDSSKKTVTFEGRSFSGALFGGDGDQSSDGSSSDEGQQSTGFNHWFACLESRGIEEKDKALLVCVLLGIKELFHDKMHKMSRRYSTKLLNLQSELREKEDTIRFLHKKLKTLQMSVAEVESLTSSTSDDDCGGILSCQRVTHTQNDHKALDESRKQSTNSPMLVKTALTQEELMELEFASALQRNLSRTDVAIRVEESTSPHHSDDDEHPARNPHAKRSSNDWEVMMLAEQMSEREKKADNLRHAAERLLSMQHQQTGRTFSQEEEEEVVSALTEFSASELDLLEKMIWEEEKNESSRSGKLKRSRSEKYSKPKKKRSASLAPGETLTSPRDPASPEMPPFGSHGVHDIWAQPSASSGVTATSSKPELTLSPSSLVPPPGGSKKKCSTSLAVAEVNKTAVAGIPEAHTIDITKN
ncbi:unnamed protein product [Notodromas monacha]|uniref:Uncharacterized protein n=2 Tax=Notodromas monacha TaxID=399045 RepID=A0A7R9GJM3_9CRUS|nr:unnamed protein product [Notodromas monacha]CAG0923830.1 unnamed protein product [Notodromas monacha]